MKKILVVIYCLLAAVCYGSIEETNKQTDIPLKNWIEINKTILSLLNEGKTQFNAGNYPEAQTCYQKILSYNPDDTSVRELQIKAQEAELLTDRIKGNYQTYNYQESLRNISELQKLNPNDNAFTELKINSEKIIALNKEAQLFFTKAQYNEAIDKYTTILAVNSTDRSATGQIEKIRKILTIKKNAMQYFVSGEYSNAKKYYQEILAKNPADAYAQKSSEQCDTALEYITAADNSISNSQFEKAFDSLNKVIELNPNDNTTQKRTIDYKKIIDYYKINQQLLKYSFYPELLTNYAAMLSILKDNEMIAREKQKYLSCKKLKEQTFSAFTSENYQEALASGTKLTNLNPLDEIASKNIAIINQAIQLKQKAQELYKSGNYQKSLEQLQALSKIKLSGENPLNTSWVLYRGKNNIVNLSALEGESISVVFPEIESITLENNGNRWSGNITIPLTTLEGANAAKVYVKKGDGKSNLYYIPYQVEDQKIVAPAGYSVQEKDLQL